MYTLNQYFRLIDNRKKVQSGCIDFDLFFEMSIAYHRNNEDDDLTRANIIRQYIKHQDSNSDEDFSKLKDYIDQIINSIEYEKDDDCEKQIFEILYEVFEDIASWEDYEFEPVNITLSHVYKEDIENKLILIEERFYLKLYKSIEREQLYIYNTGEETKILSSDEPITSINQFLELHCHVKTEGI